MATTTSTVRGELATGDQSAEIAAHTPGPWLVDSPLTRVMASTGCVADVMDGDSLSDDLKDWNYDAADANARLIASAPDLLASLKNTLILLKCFTRETDDVAKATWDEAEAAINKAEGR